MKQIFWILMIVVVVIFGAVWLSHRSKSRALNSGEVVVRKQAPDKTKPQTPQPASANQPAQASGPSAPNPAGTPPSLQAAAPSAGAALTPPSSDSIPRNPPNGVAFAGSGRYQLYRQGDITWRLNTDTGSACILFATNAQWRKSVVYSHGCGAA
jgi:hypothetical protein